MKFKIPPVNVLKILGIIILVLLILNLVSVWMQHSMVEKRALYEFFIRLFDFNQEGNIPAFFSSLLLLVAAIFLYLVYRIERKQKQNAIGWLGLSIVFVFLTLDEATQIHEFLIGYSRELFDVSGYLYYAWIIPYSAALLLLGIIYIPFFRHLNRRMLLFMLVSGAIFLSGAIGMEMLGGNQMDSEGFGLLYMSYYTLEETLEMIGTSVFIYALIWYISTIKRKITFKVNPAAGL
ncbi:hypothetical protein SAMN04488057_102385 [Cyclobacterium lianum]|uniref:Uncharacterized protein n=1 Tax=Cyclobacterium lianum TaxID=388280 RepID=A0A1M7KC20_9BACT|nr:hypothetical protein [Cyclobacterium lianum]SHM62806.1 hypothetical protein SAMN04488057_102385 [Cyclobacterium lianum]